MFKFLSMSQLRSRSSGSDLIGSYGCSQHELIMCRPKNNDVGNYIMCLGIEQDRKGPQSHIRSDRCHRVSLDASSRKGQSS